MKYLEGDIVWIPHTLYGYCKGKIIGFGEKNQITIRLLETPTNSNNSNNSNSSNNNNNQEEIKINEQLIQSYNSADEKDFNDMVEIQDLSEAIILNNLNTRYKSDQIYTYISSVLISINPYKSISNLYSIETLNQYKDINLIKSKPPHIYAVALRAYQSMISEKKNQSIIISGESGAGKTEASKSILQYLINTSNSSGNGTNGIEKDIINSNPILEAFGNSRTTKNHNSSRFGKFLKIEFRSSDMKIDGASVETYLLEKSRISHKPDTNNLCYHIFYYLVWGASDKEREQWGIENDPSCYRYLDASPKVLESFKNQSGSGSDNMKKQFTIIKESMISMSIAKETCDDIFKTLAAILHLGNIEFKGDSDNNNQSMINDDKPQVLKSLSMVAKLLGYPELVFKQSLINRNLKSGGRGSVYCRPMEIAQSEQTRDALSKSLYVKLFSNIVEKINVKFIQNSRKGGNGNGSGNGNLFIGVLDIFGFENLSVNSLDQLLINFTNEKLQQQFNLNVFETEQKEYTSQGIPWSNSNFVDNKECIELVEKKSYGLLSLLDDECLMPKGSEITLLEKYNKQYHNTNQYYTRTLAKGTLGIKHFAGDVTYTTDGWLEKNRDNVSSDVEALLLSCSNNLVKSLFKDDITISSTSSSSSANSNTASPPRERFNSGSSNSGTSSPLSNSGGNYNTNPSGNSNGNSNNKKSNTSQSVAGQFIEQLNKLISTINSTSVHYIRCIKPNVTMDCNNFNSPHVLSQLRNVGVLSTVKVRKMGYSYRRDFNQFLFRYKCILKIIKSNGNNGGSGNELKLCKDILESVNSKLVTTTNVTSNQQSKPSFQIGKNKIFISDELYIELEKKRYDSIVGSVLVIQSFFKMIKYRKQFKQRQQSTLHLQSLIRSHQKRKEFHQLQIQETKRKQEEHQKELEKKKKEDDERKKEEERKRKEEEKEEERKRKEEEKEAERKRKEEEKEAEKKRKEEEKLRKEEEKKKLKEDKELAATTTISPSTSTSSTTTNTPTTSTPTTPTSSTSTKKQILPNFKSFSNLLSKVHGNDKNNIAISTPTPVSPPSSPPQSQPTLAESISVSSDSNFGQQQQPISPRGHHFRVPLPPTPPPIKSKPISINKPTTPAPTSQSWNHTNSPHMNSSLRNDKSRARIGRLTIRSSSPLLFNHDISIGLKQTNTTKTTTTTPSTSSPPSSSDEDSDSDNINNNHNNKYKPTAQRNITTSLSPSSSNESLSNDQQSSSPNQPPHNLSPLSLSPLSVFNGPTSFGIPGETIENKNRRFRVKIIKEILETERDYIRDLNIVVDVFLTPIREKQLLTVKDINLVFSNIEILLSISLNVLKAIEKEGHDPSHETTNIGQTFLDMSDYFKMYTAFCSNQQNAFKLLEEEKLKNQPLRDFLDSCMQDIRCRGLPLNSFIIKPVQRICKYPLLIKEAIKFTPDGHPDKQPLEEVDVKISLIVQSINEAKRTYEMFQKIVELQNSIDGLEDTNLMEQGRTLLMEGTVSAVKELNSEDSLSRTIYLFNNLILICSFGTNVLSSALNQFKSKKMKLKAKIPITDSRLMFVSDTDSVKFALEIVNTRENENYILCFNNDQDRTKWFKTLKSLIQETKLLNTKRTPIGSSRLSLTATN